MDLVSRIDWVLANRKYLGTDRKPWSASAWSLKAGLRRTHVTTLRNRLLENPDSGQEVQTLRSLAIAAEVDPSWLCLGVGTPDSDPASAPSAARRMGLAMGFDPDFVAGWDVGPSGLDAESLWTLLKADYIRRQA